MRVSFSHSFSLLSCNKCAHRRKSRRLIAALLSFFWQNIISRCPPTASLCRQLSTNCSWPFFPLKWRKGVHITGQRSLISDILCPIYVFTTVKMNDTSCHRLYKTEVKHPGCKRCHPSESIPTYASLGQLTAGLSCQSRENRRTSYSNT